MGIRLCYSHRTEALAEKLAANLRADAVRGGAFSAATIIIPNKNLEQWLKMDIARRNTIATNLTFPFLEKGLWDLLARIDPAPGEKPDLLTEETCRFFILSELMRITPGDADLKPLWEYLHDARGRRVIDYYRKAWQLSAKLEKCFREYEYNREAMVSSWLAGMSYYADAADVLKAMERCQRIFYVRVFGPGGAAARLAADGALLTLPQYERRVFSSGKVSGPQKSVGAPAVHIFGLSQISEFHTRLLFEIGRSYDIRLYQLNVCSEFWEDVTTPQEDRFRKFRAVRIEEGETGQYLRDNPKDNRLLKLWGKPGRENIKLLSELEEACAGKVEFESEWSLPEAGKVTGERTVLRAVQDRILLRLDESSAMAQDTSIQIAGCPGVYREAETVYNSIIDNMRKDPTLNLTDIAVLVPTMSVYKSALKSVFSRGSRGSRGSRLVPYNLSDATASEESVYAQAVQSLIDLVEGPFSRQKVFSLILNDCFLAAAGVSREDALIWLRWADELNIFHSFDEGEKCDAGYGVNSLYTWQQGLERLRFGRIMDACSAGPGGSAGLDHYKGIVPFSDMDSENALLIGSFSIAVEMLAARIAALRGKSYRCEVWAEKVGRLIDETVRLPPTRPEEERVYYQTRRALESLVLRDALFGDVAFAFVAEHLQACLEKIPAGHGKYLAGGVTISSLLPMRPIPFRIVYCMGLDEGRFPGNPDRSTLDLRNYKRRIGDVSMPEANRYLFLETLMSVREKLYLTYVSRDTRKDEALHPCSVVTELRGYLDDHLLTGAFRTLKDAYPAWPDDIPLKGSSVKYLADPSGVRSWSDIAATYSVTDRLVALLDLKNAGVPKLTHRTVDAIGKKRRELVRWDLAADGADTAAAGDGTAAEVERITIPELAAFLKNPIEASVRRHLEIYDDEDDHDPFSAEDEPFYSAFPANYDFSVKLLEHVIERWQEGGEARKDPAAYVQRRLASYYEYCRLQGKTPDAVFGRLDRERFEAKLLARLAGDEGLAAFLERHSACAFTGRMAIGGVTSGSTLANDPLRLTVTTHGERREVELRGELPFVWKDEASALLETIVVTMKKSVGKDTVPSYILKPFLFYLALVALAPAGKHKKLSLAIHIACEQKIVSAWTYAVSKRDAHAYLSALAGDLLDHRSFDLIPLELALDDYVAGAADGTKPSDDMVVQYRAGLEERIAAAKGDDYAAYRPSRLVSVIGASVPPDAYEKVARRLAWIVDANTFTKEKDA